MEDRVVPVDFEVSVILCEGGTTRTETTRMTVDCPILGATDWGRVVCDEAAMAELQSRNLQPVDILFVQTPVKCYYFNGGLALCDPSRPPEAYAALYAPSMRGILTDPGQVDRIPEDLHLLLYRSQNGYAHSIMNGRCSLHTDKRPEPCRFRPSDCQKKVKAKRSNSPSAD